MLHHHIVGVIKTLGVLLIFCALNVRSDLITPNESSLTLRLIDIETNIFPISTLIVKKKTSVVVDGLGWILQDAVSRKIDNSFVHKPNEDIRLIYSTFVNEQKVANGTVELSTWNTNNTGGFSSSIDVGVIEVEKPGLNTIHVMLYSVSNGDIIESSTTLNVRSHWQWTTSIPIVVAFGSFLVFNFHIIHSLFFAMFIGSWIIEGSMVLGFRAVIEKYLLGAVTDNVHASLLLFVLGISTLMTMVKKSGGTFAVIYSLRNHSSKTRAAQIVFFTTGVVFFFDPYVSIMVVGKVFGSIFQGFPLSSEKISFLIDATAAPVASIVPKSTWLTLAGELVQIELDKMVERQDEESYYPSGNSMILSSIRYQFYPCLLLVLVVLQILTGREMGPILKAENQARFSYNISHQNDDGHIMLRRKLWNWYIPVSILAIMLWYSFSQVGFDNTESIQDPSLFVNSWSLSVVATIILTQVIFIIQRRNGRIPFLDSYLQRKERDRIAYLTDTFPSVSSSASMLPYNEEETGQNQKCNTSFRQKLLTMSTEDDDNVVGKKQNRWMKDAPLLNLNEGVACIVQGIVIAIPILLSLVFTWATSSVYIALGMDRMIVSWILSDNISIEILPISVFLASFLLSLITGSSLCSISILIPGITLSLVDSSDGDLNILILTLASMLSGAAAGDHIGPFSETTILSAIISRSEVRRHFLTQAPYALFVFILSSLVGILPLSYNGYPDYIGYIIGVVVLILFVILVSRQVERYHSSIPGQIHNKRVTTKSGGNVGEGLSSRGEVDSFDRMLDEEKIVSILQSSTQGIEIRPHNLRSFKYSLQRNHSNDCDPIFGPVEDQMLTENISTKNKKSKKRLIEATIKKANQDGNMFSESLRTFLRTAEHKLGKILDKNGSLEIGRSTSAESTGGDSLDNLMMDIASKGWKVGIDNLLGDETDVSTSAGEYYTTDGTEGGSTMLESDDSVTATSSYIDENGQSTIFTGNCQSTIFTGNGQSTIFTGNGDATSSASSVSATEYTSGTSHLMNPLKLNKTRRTLQHKWNDSVEVDDIFTVSF